jgi:hypothetical protein
MGYIAAGGTITGQAVVSHIIHPPLLICSPVHLLLLTLKLKRGWQVNGLLACAACCFCAPVGMKLMPLVTAGHAVFDVMDKSTRHM